MNVARVDEEVNKSYTGGYGDITLERDHSFSDGVINFFDKFATGF